MHWYYEENGVQVGPFTEQQFEDQVMMGKVNAATLVWRDGMAGWQPYSTVAGRAPARAAAPPPIMPRTFSCSQCGRNFHQDDMIRYQNLWVCASCKGSFFQRMKEGLAPGGAAMWRDNNKLVVGRDSQLPDRCVKCNAPSSNRLVKKMYWHSQVYYLLICLGFLFYIIAALIVRKQATVVIGLCDTHFQKRKTAILVTWVLVGLTALSFFIAAAADVGALAAVGLLLLLTAMIYGIITIPMVAPTRIDDRFVWIKGVNSQYLAALPEYMGQ